MTAKDSLIQQLKVNLAAALTDLDTLKGEVKLALLDAPEGYRQSIAEYVQFLEEGLEHASNVQKDLEETLKIRDAIIQRLDDGWRSYFPKPDGDPVWYKTDAMDPSRLISLHRMTDAERVEYHQAIAAPEEHPDSDAHTN